ncbi:TIGR02450 family Trp-rich protein [Prochlorococcus sp. MIT 1307]|uniref:TIGR02450 family Trp-rich protein n=1 Tax=Prochlorococcus sp. MIT 1307 TaxID=3096219 RepID=UPI002A762F76|nr:TIGR02450 family Trp-rich protein [Prochlorococcus sp. MIT 1307]
MRWPPNKSWTSIYSRNGYRHFVAINYGGKKKERWVALVSVLDGKSRFVVPWSEMQDNSKWISGWLSLAKDEANSCSEEFGNIELAKACLHPSKDSGLLIPSEKNLIRPWDYD